MSILQLIVEHCIALTISAVVICIFGYLQWKRYTGNVELISLLKQIFLKEKQTSGYKIYFIDDVCQIKPVKDKEQLNSLIEEINLYVQKSIGTADFNIIQNKTERKIESLYEHATAELSFPTYIGLMGTFTGTFLGLVGFLVSGNDLSDESKVTNLIIGVLVSMLTSLFGLVLTTRSNHLAAVTKKELDQQKDIFLDFIQLELIPKLQTTVTTLQQTLEGFVPKFDEVISNFEKTFSGVIGRFKDTFDECTKNFGTEFRQNTRLISHTVSTLNDSIGHITENVENQRKLLEELRSESMFYTLERFVEAANTFQGTTSAINEYNEMLRSLLASTQSVIKLQTDYANSLHVPQSIVLQLNRILDRITTFEQNINALGENIAQTKMLGNQELLLIQKHLESFEEKKPLADRFLDTSNEELELLFREQGKLVKALFDNYQQQMENERDELSAFVRETMQIITKKKNDLLTHLEKAFDVGNVNAMFSHLKSLPEIEKKLEEIEKGIIRNEQLEQHIKQLADFYQLLNKSLMEGKSELIGQAKIGETKLQEHFSQVGTMLDNIRTVMNTNASKQVSCINDERNILSKLLQDYTLFNQSAHTELSTKIDNLDKVTRKGLNQLHKETGKESEDLNAIIQMLTLPQRGKIIMSILEAIKERNK